MLKLKILSIGKTKEAWLEEALSEYLKRLKPYMSVEWIWAKDNNHLLELSRKEPLVIGLDPTGHLFSSEEFATFLEEAWEKGGSRLTMVIGGAEGLLPPFKKEFTLVSLSPMTFTHQMTRLLLIEQIYRATEIKKGSQYHK